ncbi:MAG: lytic transglycosylase domain-containing protein [Bryobacterales bacterium]|nr:lytic transglycosylase domain-containing protein [Bryobacterales bacterium]MEB2361272.1 lytic transglycosylase domain-containing protein [Bryobacterales bacterium]
MTVAEQITAAALRNGIDPRLALAVASKESGLNQAARGSKGEIGVFQLMPGTAKDLGVNPLDLSQNIEGGVRYLRQLLHRYGDPGKALAAYNGGPGNMDRGTTPAAAWNYAADVLSKLGLPVLTGQEPAFSAALPTLPAPDAEDTLPSGLVIAGAIAAAAAFLLITA